MIVNHPPITVMGCFKKVKKIITVFVTVVLLKVTFSGLDILSDGFTASELAGYGSPLAGAQR